MYSTLPVAVTKAWQHVFNQWTAKPTGKKPVTAFTPLWNLVARCFESPPGDWQLPEKSVQHESPASILWVWCSFLFPNAFMWAWLAASSSKSIALSGRDQSGIFRAEKYPAASTALDVMSHLWWSLYPLLSPTKIFTESSNLGPQCAHLELSRAPSQSLNPSNCRILLKVIWGDIH